MVVRTERALGEFSSLFGGIAAGVSRIELPSSSSLLLGRFSVFLSVKNSHLEQWSTQDYSLDWPFMAESVTILHCFSALWGDSTFT